MNHALVNDEIDGWVTCMTEGEARPGVGPSALRLLDICRSNTCHSQSSLSYYGQRRVEKKTCLDSLKNSVRCSTVQAWPSIREAKSEGLRGLYAGNF